MDHKTCITTVEGIESQLKAVEKRNSFENDALIRCTTLKRCLGQAMAQREAEAKAIEAADKQVQAALENQGN